MMTAVMLAAVSSCSKDDEPNDYQPTYDGVAIYLNAIEKFYDNEGTPAFTLSDKEGIYLAEAESETVAANWIKQIIENPNWDGKDVTIKLGENGEEGTLKIVGNTPDLMGKGIYNEIDVDIKNYIPYTLEIIAENSENGYGKDIVVIK